MVAFVQVNNDIRHTNLFGEQDVFTSLGHRAVRRGNDQNSSVHLGGAGDHILDIVGVTRTVNVSVMTFIRFVLNMISSNGNTSLLLFGGIINLVNSPFFGFALLGEHVGDRGRQSCFTVVNVTDGANIDMKFISFKFICHLYSLSPLT